MERRCDKVYAVFAVIPIFCIGVDTTLLSSLSNSLRTGNNSFTVLGNYDEHTLYDNFFDVLNRIIQSSKSSNLYNGAEMRRESRSFDNPFLSSIKREKEDLEDIEDLQYYGSEIPKKFTEKRFKSAVQYSLRNVLGDRSGSLRNVLGDRSGSLRNVLGDRSGNILVTPSHQRSNSDSRITSMEDNSGFTKLSTVSVISETVQLSQSEDIEDSSKVPNLTSHLLNSNNVVISKRRFPPRRGHAEVADVCNMDDLEIDISFREMMDTDAGSLLLTCTGSVVVKKCEGACNSQVKPSVNNYDGFDRQCSCCKDSAVATRDVTLSICTLGPEEVHGYSISRTIVEPTACSCQECRN